jgi:hypothetical protein
MRRHSIQFQLSVSLLNKQFDHEGYSLLGEQVVNESPLVGDHIHHLAPEGMDTHESSGYLRGMFASSSTTLYKVLQLFDRTHLDNIQVPCV